MTREERRLWYDCFKVGMQAKRQKPIGPYIADLYIASAKIVLEPDGSRHSELTGQAHDQARDRFPRERDLTVPRRANSGVNRNFPGVCEDITRHPGMEL